LATEKGEWQKMRSLMGGMEEALKELRMVPLADSLGGLPRLVRDLCRRAEKNGLLEISGGNIRTDKRIVELLAEPLTHLIRNAVDHGLETSDVRAEANKNPEGLIELNITQTDDELILVLTDDGAGINRQTVLTEASNRGILGEEERDTLHYLTQPGFTTRKTASPLSGRGFGLDLIARTIRQEAGGTLSMTTQPGQGTSFTLQIPRGYQPTVLLLFKSGGEIYGIPKRGDANVAEILEAELWDRREEGLFWNDMPVFSPQGRFIPGTNLPEGKVGILFSHLGQQSCILADDILFEQEISEDQMSLGKEVSPHVYEYYQNGEKKEFLYLDPSFLV